MYKNTDNENLIRQVQSIFKESNGNSRTEKCNN